MTIGNYQRKVKEGLRAIYDENEARAIASLLFENITGFSGMQLTLNRTKDLAPAQISKIDKAVAELMRHKPIQYVLHEAWFMEMRFYVNESVLIPRPETEELVKIVAGFEGRFSKAHILDIGTGSGCIPVALKKLLPVAMVTSIDLSEKALEVACKNANDHGCFIQFQQVDFLDRRLWPSFAKFDIIVSNPPYIPVSEKEKIDINVRDWEPGEALFVPADDPLVFYRHIAEFAIGHLSDTGTIIVEIHQDYAADALQLFEENGFEAIVKKDMYENDRIIIAQKNM